jgi:transcriptional regulator with XRE-family HTH domain
MLTHKQLSLLRAYPVGATRNNLRFAMQLGNVTQVQLAAALNVSQSQISEDINGKYAAMSLDKARAYARFFGCHLEDLFPAREEVAS